MTSNDASGGASVSAPGGHGLLIVERILRDRDDIWRQIIEERDLNRLILQMLSSSAISLAVYGAVLGASNGWLQAISSTLKLPLLFLATLAICLPTLYLFNLVFGARLSMQQAVALIMVTITVTSVLTLAFAPISLFFLISAQSYSFFKLLNVCILMLTAIVGLRFLTVGMRALNEHHEVAALPASPFAVIAGAPASTASASAQAGPVGALASAEPGVVPVAALAAAPEAGGPGGAGTPAPRAPGVDDAPPAQVAKALPAAAGNGGAQPVTLPVYPGVPIGVGPHPGMVPPPGAVRHIPGQPLPRPPAPRPPATGRPASMSLLYVWIVLFGFVGTQLAWTLRPFFGSPGEPFQIFRSIEGTFYGDIFRTIGHLLGG